MIFAIVIPSFVKARNTSAQNACINNLRIIDPVISVASALSVAEGDTNTISPAERLERIRIPNIEMKQAYAIDVADYLMTMCDLNPHFAPSIILNLEKTDEHYRRGKKPDPRMVGYTNLPLVTTNLTNVSLLEAVRALTTAAGLSYQVTNGIVIIYGPDGRDMRKDKWANQAAEYGSQAR